MRHEDLDYADSEYEVLIAVVPANRKRNRATMRLLVTGSSGFLGGSIGRLAKRDGHQVLGVSHLASPSGGWPGEFVQFDISHPDFVTVIRDFAPDVVWHAAGPASVIGLSKRRWPTCRPRCCPGGNTLDCIRRARLLPLVFFPSSAAVYGEPASVPVRESAPSSCDLSLRFSQGGL